MFAALVSNMIFQNYVSYLDNLNILVFTMKLFLISLVLLVYMGTNVERNTSTALVGYANIFHLFLPL